MKKVVLGFCLLFFVNSYALASPCENIDRSLTNEKKAILAPIIEKQLNVTGIDVLQSFHDGEWSIIYVATREADPAFLFFSADPQNSRYVTLWGGAAGVSEEQDLYEWTLKNATGIPEHLALVLLGT